MKNELGHILPILPSDLTILLSSLTSLTVSSLMAFPPTITLTHVSERCTNAHVSLFMQQLNECCSALQCWPGDWILGFHWCLLSRRAEEAPHSRSTFCLRLLSDGIGPFWPLCEVRGDNKFCQFNDLPSSMTPWAVTPSFFRTSDWGLISQSHKVLTHPENGSFIVQAASAKAASNLQPCLRLTGGTIQPVSPHYWHRYWE